MTVDPVHINEATFDEQTRDGRILVDFWNRGCAPCRAMAPVLAEIAAEVPSLRVLKVNTDEEPGLVRRFGVVSAPTLLVLRDGEERGRLVGARPKARLLRELEGLW